MPREITVGCLKVKVALFVPKPMRCFNCNKSGHTNQRCKVAAKCQWCRNDKHEGQCEGPKLCSNCNGPHASSARDCPVWKKEKEIQRVRVEKRISFAGSQTVGRSQCRLWSLAESPSLLLFPPVKKSDLWSVKLL